MTQENEITMHKATSMSSTLCGVPNNIINHGWTNDITKINCMDCFTIIEIKSRNQINNVEHPIENLIEKLKRICEYYELHNKDGDAEDLRNVIAEYHKEKSLTTN